MPAGSCQAKARVSARQRSWSGLDGRGCQGRTQGLQQQGAPVEVGAQQPDVAAAVGPFQRGDLLRPAPPLTRP